ncbi:MAG: VTT domain-containing protein [Elusimicrobiota bacterium]
MNFLTRHLALASFLWGLFKSLAPLPSPSGFVILGAEAARSAAGLRESAGHLFLEVILPGAAGMALGGFPYYFWARSAGREAVKRWGPRFGVSQRRVRSLEARAERHRGALIVGLFALPLTPLLLAAFVAAALDFSPEGYVALAFLGTVVRCSVLTSIGWAFRSHFGDPIFYVGHWGLAAAGVVAAGLGAFVVWSRFRPARSDAD